MRVFIACSASDNAKLEYRTLASEVSTNLAKNGHKLVFGGADTGMMGKCYMTFKYEGAKTKAVAEIHDAELVKELEVDAYEITPTTFERTKELFNSSELVLILPGGLGTFAEFFSILDEKRQKGLDTPIVLFNYDNFYTPLLNFMKKCHEENLISERDLKQFGIVTDTKSLELYINSLKK